MRERSIEEIHAILQAFPEVFEIQFGKTLNIDELKGIVLKILKEKELQLIEQRFFDFSPKNLREILKIIERKAENNAKQPTNVLPKPTKSKNTHRNSP